MRYVLDANSMSVERLSHPNASASFIVLRDIAEEWGVDGVKRLRTVSKGAIKPAELQSVHYEKLKEVMTTHGTDNRLISLSTGKGAGDAIILAYVLGEKDGQSNLFSVELGIVTDDIALRNAADYYKIRWVAAKDAGTLL